MELVKRVETDIKQAMKARQELEVSCLRLISNALKLKSKDLRRPLTEEEDLQILKSLAKQRREAHDLYQQARRLDLADREKAELVIIESYLPSQMDEGAINAVLDEAFALLQPQGPKDMGRVMKEVMAKVAGRADGKLVNQLVRQRFEE